MTGPDKPATDAGYLEAASRIIFMGGLNRRVVDGKWDGFLEAFHGFDVAAVAAMGPADVEQLAQDDRVIKYQAKLQAVVTNAQEMQQVAAEHGSFGAWVESAVAAGVPAACADAVEAVRVHLQGRRPQLALFHRPRRGSGDRQGPGEVRAVPSGLTGTRR